jgi:uncharacterized membrane protein
MVPNDVIMPHSREDGLPEVRQISVSDLKDVLAKGLDDFRAMPTHAIFLCALYPIVGLLLGRMVFALDVLPLLYPLAGGFALVGPIAAIGLYELSRRRELGLDTNWTHAFDVIHSPSRAAIMALGGLLLVIFAFWIAAAHSIYASSGLGEPSSLDGFLYSILDTPAGRSVLVLGNLVGLLFAVLTFVTTVVSFPLLLDRDVGFAGAIITSFRVVRSNPLTMAVWGLIIAAGLFIGALPLLFGLAVVLPVLGHATWHLYRKAVVPDPNPRPEYRPGPKGIRYGAQFPYSLFAPYRPARSEEKDDT